MGERKARIRIRRYEVGERKASIRLRGEMK